MFLAESLFRKSAPAEVPKLACRIEIRQETATRPMFHLARGATSHWLWGIYHISGTNATLQVKPTVVYDKLLGAILGSCFPFARLLPR